jgi:hypothetical protein
MKSLLRILGLSTILLLPISAAHAAAPTVAAISDVSVNAGASATVNVVAVDLDGDAIVLTSSLPSFVTLNAPTTGNGLVVTTLTLAPMAANVGTFNGSITATAGGQQSTETFLITVVETGANQAPLVTAPASLNATVGTNLTFTVTATDADGDPITNLTATGAPSGSTFTPNGTFTSGDFSWTPTAGQAGTGYDVVFTASNSLSGSATTHIEVIAVTIAPINDITVAEGSTASVGVNVTATPGTAVAASASLPGFATLNAPTTGTGTLSTTINIAPPAGSAGTYHASVTATANASTSTTETFDIFVVAAGANTPPDVTAPSTLTVNEGVNLTFTVNATDANGDHVTLTASGVPSGATFTDNGDNTGTFSWTPGSTQAGVYNVTFTGDDGHGGTDAATTNITVNDVPGGGGNQATVRILGQFMTKKDRTCVSIRPVQGSFDVRNVDLSTIVLSFNGQTLAAISGKTHLQFDCDDDDGDSHDGDCGDRHDAAALGAGDGCGDCDDDCDCHDDCGDCDHDCDECDGNDDHDGDCTAVGIRACFSTQQILDLFGDTDLPGGFADATVTGSFVGGGTFTAVFDVSKLVNHDNGKKKGLNAKAKPNPLNPKTEVTFTLSKPGRVRVSVYDLQGRLVNTLLDEVRPVGEQRVTWDGSNARSQRVSSGMYYFRIQAPEGNESKGVAVVK